MRSMRRTPRSTWDTQVSNRSITAPKSRCDSPRLRSVERDLPPERGSRNRSLQTSKPFAYDGDRNSTR